MTLALRPRPSSLKAGDILDLFDLGTDGEVYVQRVSADLYNLLRHLGDGFYWSVQFHNGQAWGTGLPPGGYNLHQLHRHSVGVPMLDVDQEDAAVVHTGTWTAIQTAIASAYSGNYRHNSANAGTSVTFTTPANTVAVGIHQMKVNNGGIGKVLIDGDATLANRLSTAQQLVDAGTLPSTVLVANGGTLNPTDRVIDFYNSATVGDTPIVAADGLAPGVHTLKIEHTGYKRAASSAARLYSAGYTYATSTTTVATAGMSIVGVWSLLDGDSSWNRAEQHQPPGAATPTFCGEVHGYEQQTALTLYVDGVETTMTNGQVLSAAHFRFERTSNLLHPETGATVHANCADRFELAEAYGLRVTSQTTWRTATVVSSGYAAMFPVAGGVFDTGKVLGSGELDLSVSDDAQMGKLRSPVAWLWDSTGELAAFMHVPNALLAGDGWTRSAPNFTSIQRRTGSPAMRKVYLARNQPTQATEVVSDGEVWAFGPVHYGVKRFDDAGDVFA